MGWAYVYSELSSFSVHAGSCYERGKSCMPLPKVFSPSVTYLHRASFLSILPFLIAKSLPRLFLAAPLGWTWYLFIY